MTLNEKYKTVCEAYIKAFEKKQGYEFTGWISDDDFELAIFHDNYFINMDDPRRDIIKQWVIQMN